MGFGARLKEERNRLGLKQAEFAALVGSDVPKQSLYENDRRSLRAGYLARIGAAGVDLLYVVTGARGEGASLDDRTGELLMAYYRLSPEARAAVAEFVGELSRQGGRSPARKG